MKAPAFNRALRQLVALPIVLLVLLAGFVFWQIESAPRAQRELDHSDQVTAQLQELLNLFIDQETGLRGFQLTADPLMLAPWEAAAGPIQSHLANLREMLTTDTTQEASLSELEGRYNQWLGFARAVLHEDPSALKAAGVNQQGKAMMDSVRATTARMLRHESDLRETKYRLAQRLQRQQLISLVVSAVVVGIFLALFTWHHVRAISASYQRRISEITERSEQLSESRLWFQTTLESIGDAVIACDVGGRV